VKTIRTSSYIRGLNGGRLAHTGLITGLVLSGVTTAFATEDLGIIQVESTTIDDKFEAKREEPSNIAVISGKQIDKQHTQNIQQVLQGIPGITTETQSGDSIKIHIRGVENQRYMGEKPGVAVVIDGVPVFERTGRVNIDMDNIESIKVIKGGASYLFGDDALSGAVVITTKRGAQYAGVHLGAEAGSWNYEKYLGRAGFANDYGAGHIQVSKRQGNGYYHNSDFRTKYVNGKLQYYIDDDSDITFGMEISDREKDSHGTVDGLTASKLDPKSKWIENDDYTRMYEVHLEKFFATYSNDLNDTDNLLVSAYQFTDQTNFISRPINGFRDPSNAVITDPDAYAYGNDYYQVQRGIKTEYRSAGDELAWMAGLDLRANTYENNVEYINTFRYYPFGPLQGPGVTDDNETEETMQAVYGELKFRVADPFIVTLNGRFDHIDLDYTDNLNDLKLDRYFDVWSWRMGGNYEVNESTDLYGNMSTGFRAPSVQQLFAGDMDPSGGTASNPNLEPEEATNLEIGLRRKFSMMGINWDLDTAIFKIDRDDYIMSSAGQYGKNPDGLDQQYQNIGGMRNQGLELTLRSDSTRTFWVNVAYSYLDAIFTDYDNYNLLLGNRYPSGPPPRTFDANIDGNADGVCDAGAEYNPATQYCIEHYDLGGNQVPRAPKHHLNIGLNWRAAPHWTITGEIESKSSFFADELNWNKVDGHTVFNLLANYEREFGDTTLTFFARVDNVFDYDYWNSARGSYDSSSPGTGNAPDGVFNMEDVSIVVNQGRTFTAGLSFSF